MLVRHVALVSESKQIKPGDVAKVAAAMQKQATRDFSPIWKVPATVDAFATLEDIPLEYWPVIIMDDIKEKDAAGVHLDKDGQPFALVQVEDGWQQTVSHETIEMLVDPFGNRLAAGKSPKKGQGRVRFLVEACDPCEATEFGYTVNGILLSDFYTPNYFDPVASPGIRYSYTGAISKPRQVLQGGYLSWQNPIDGHWWQEQFFGAEPQFKDIGPADASVRSLRSWIDGKTHPQHEAELKKMTAIKSEIAKMLVSERTPGTEADNSTKARGERLRTDIAEIIKS